LCFVFFYALKDNEKLKDLIKDFSPISKSKEKILKHQFKEITSSLIYGQVIVGIIQGLVAGLGFLIFGVPNALALTVAAIIFSLIPLIGPWIIWIPVLTFMILSGGASTTTIVLFFLYNLIIVSTVDNIIRAYIVSRRSNLSGGIVFIGMIGGLYLFGIFGLIIGPLILSYFITFFQSFKEENRFEVMAKEEPSTQNIPIIDKKIHLPFFEKK
jgi:predicted PurR-regulated permease PerM